MFFFGFLGWELGGIGFLEVVYWGFVVIGLWFVVYGIIVRGGELELVVLVFIDFNKVERICVRENWDGKWVLWK